MICTHIKRFISFLTTFKVRHDTIDVWYCMMVCRWKVITYSVMFTLARIFLIKTLQGAHKSYRTKMRLAKKQKQNRPVPQWVRMKTGNTIRCVNMYKIWCCREKRVIVPRKWKICLRTLSSKSIWFIYLYLIPYFGLFVSLLNIWAGRTHCNIDMPLHWLHFF